jgi:hypothetical protein
VAKHLGYPLAPDGPPFSLLTGELVAARGDLQGDQAGGATKDGATKDGATKDGATKDGAVERSLIFPRMWIG